MNIDCMMNAVEAAVERNNQGHPCRYVGDIQLRQRPLLHVQHSIADATAYLKNLCIGLLPVRLWPDSDQMTLSSVHVIDAKSMLERLIACYTENVITLDQFFEILLCDLPDSLGCIVGPDFQIVSAVKRMYDQHSDLLLVYDRLNLSGLVTSSEVLDEIVGIGTFVDSLFDVHPMSMSGRSGGGSSRTCYFNQPIGNLVEAVPVIQLNANNTLLTATRILLNKRYDHLFLSNQEYQSYQFVTPELLLYALLDYCEKCLEDGGAMDLRSVMMMRLGTLFDFSSVRLTCETTVQEAVETLCFNDLRCVPVYSDDAQLCGILTRRCILRAFLESMGEIMQ